jgi:hypothetical protein
MEVYKITQFQTPEYSNLDTQPLDNFKFLSDSIMITRMTHVIFPNLRDLTRSDESTSQWRTLAWRTITYNNCRQSSSLISFHSTNLSSTHLWQFYATQLSPTGSESLKNSYYCYFYLKHLNSTPFVTIFITLYLLCDIQYKELRDEEHDLKVKWNARRVLWILLQVLRFY